MNGCSSWVGTWYDCGSELQSLYFWIYQTSIMLSNVYTLIHSLWLMQHSFLPKSAPVDWPLVWVFAFTGGKKRDHLVQHFNVHPSRGGCTVEISSKFSYSLCLYVCAWGVNEKVGGRLAAPGLLQDGAKLWPIIAAERDVGRRLLRHSWNHPQCRTAQESLNLTDCWKDLYIWCHRRRRMKYSLQK